MRVTAGVTAGAYLRGDKRRAYLTHRVELDPSGRVVRVCCRRVALTNILPDSATYTNDKPTCRDCARRFEQEAD